MIQKEAAPNPGDIMREFLLIVNEDRLRELAFNAIRKGKKPNRDFFVILIDVDDPSWTDLVDLLMPGYNWDAIRAAGDRPIARGTPTPAVGKLIASMAPGVAQGMSGEVEPGYVRTLVLAHGGASVYTIQLRDISPANN